MLPDMLYEELKKHKFLFMIFNVVILVSRSNKLTANNLAIKSKNSKVFLLSYFAPVRKNLYAWQHCALYKCCNITKAKTIWDQNLMAYDVFYKVIIIF